MATLRLTWNSVAGAVSYNLYNNTKPGLSTAFSPILINTTSTTHDHTGLTVGDLEYYIVAAIGPNGEIGPPSEELGVIVTAIFTELRLCAQPLTGGGLVQPFQASVVYEDTTTQNVTNLGAVFASSNTSVAQLTTPPATFTLESAGSTNISVTYQLVTTQIPLTVENVAGSLTEIYDRVNNLPSSPPSGYSHAPVTPYLSGLAKIGNIIVATNSANAWYSGSGADGNYPFVVSTDGGSTWVASSWPQSVDATMALDGEDFYNYNIWATDKFMVGCDGTVSSATTNFVTSTDGINWNTSVKIGAGTDAIAAIHGTSNNLWAISDWPNPCKIYHSTDDGATWAVQNTFSAGPYYFTVFVNNSTDVWIGGSHVQYYNGSTWTDVTTNIQTAITNAGSPHGTGLFITSIWASSPTDVYAVDDNWNNHQLYHTTDHGATWTVIDIDPSNHFYPEYISGSSASNIFIAGYASSASNVYKSTDGTTWVRQTLPSSPANVNTDDYLGVYFDSTTAYIVGQNILKQGVGGLQEQPLLIQSISLSIPDTNMAIGYPEQVTATSLNVDGTNSNVTSQITWASSDTGVATIDSNGILHATTTGTTTITARIPGTYACIPGTLTLNTTSLSSITVSAASPSGTTQQFTATGTYDDSSTRTITNYVTWSSTNTSVITVDSYGLGTYVGAGTATVRATVGIIVGSTNISAVVPYWEQSYINTSNPQPIWGISGSSDGVNIFAEYDTTNPSTLVSNNSGGSWSLTVGAGANGFAQNSQGRVYDSGTTVFMVGSKTGANANLIYSTDNGASWIGNNIIDSQTTIFDIHGTGPTNIYLMGTSGLYHSVNDGVSWTNVVNNTPVITNGTFEAGSFTGWTVTSTGTGVATATTTNPHSGTYAGQIGGTAAYSGDVSIKQNFTVPTGTSTLSFWFRIFGTDSISFDWYQAQLRDSTGTTLLIDFFAGLTGWSNSGSGTSAIHYINSNTAFSTPNTASSPGTTWHNITADLSSYAGQTVQLFFLAHDDNAGGDPSYLVVDDVILTGGPPSFGGISVLPQWIYATGTNDVWLGGNGLFYHWNGTTLSSNLISAFTLAGGSTAIVSRQGIWAADANNVWVSVFTSSYSKAYVYRTTNGGTTWTIVPYSITEVDIPPGFGRHPMLGPSSSDAEHLYLGTTTNHLYYYHEGEWIDTQRPNAGDGEVFDLWSNGTVVYHTSNAYIGRHPGRTAIAFTPTSISVYPNAQSYGPNHSVQYIAFATYNNELYDITQVASWQSSNTSIATVNSTGLVTTSASGSGTSTITATYGISGSATIYVNLAVPEWTKRANVGLTTALTSSISFGDENTYIAGYDRTTSNGKIFNWDGYSLNTVATISGTSQLRTIWGIDPTVALWAGGSTNYFGKSTDGGRSWVTQSAPDGSNLGNILSIAGGSSSTFWLLQDNSTAYNLYKTTNSGSTFSAQVFTSAQLISDSQTTSRIAGNGPNDIYVLCSGVNGQLYHSTGDGTWTHVPTWNGGTGDGNGAFNSSMYVDSTGRLYLATQNGNGNGYLKITTDGGTTWTTASIGGITNQYCGVIGFDDNHVWAFVSNAGVFSCDIYFSSDQGSTWTFQKHFSNGFCTGGYAVSATEVYLCLFNGSDQGVWVTNDGGTTYSHTYNTASTYQAWGVSGAVYAVGANSVLIYSSDHGATWTPQTISGLTTQTLNGVWGTSASDVWVIGSSGSLPQPIYHSTGNGTWTLQSTGSSASSQPTCIWGTARGGIYVGMYGGSAPAVVYHMGPTAGLVRKLYTSPSNSSAFYACGDNGYVSYYDGSGFNKTLYYTPGSNTIYNTIWASSANGSDQYVYVGGQSGGNAIALKLDATTLQNITQLTVNSGTSSNVVKISGADDNHIWAAVNTGTIPATVSQDNELRKLLPSTNTFLLEPMINGDDTLASLNTVSIINTSNFRGIAGDGNDGYFYSRGALASITVKTTNSASITSGSVAFSNSSIFIAGVSGNAPAIYGWNGDTLTVLFTDSANTGLGASWIWGYSKSSLWFADAAQNRLYHSTDGNGTSWTLINPASVPWVFTASPSGAWGPSDAEFYVAGYDISFLPTVYHTLNTGSTYTALGMTTFGIPNNNSTSYAINGVTGTSSSDVWVVAFNGGTNLLYLSHWNGSSWSAPQTISGGTISSATCFANTANEIYVARYAYSQQALMYRVTSGGSQILQTIPVGIGGISSIFGNGTNVYAVAQSIISGSNSTICLLKLTGTDTWTLDLTAPAFTNEIIAQGNIVKQTGYIFIAGGSNRLYDRD